MSSTAEATVREVQCPRAQVLEHDGDEPILHGVTPVCGRNADGPRQIATSPSPRAEVAYQRQHAWRLGNASPGEAPPRKVVQYLGQPGRRHVEE